MLVRIQTFVECTLIIIFSSQVLISALVYFYYPLGGIINTLYLQMLIVVIFLIRSKIDLIGVILLLIPTGMLVSGMVHSAISNRFDLAPILKALFVSIAYIAGFFGALKYRWNLKTFSYIGLITLAGGALSLVLGKIIGVAVLDATYESGLVGLSVHPAITAMIIASSIPYLLSLQGAGKYLKLLAYLCVFLTMRRTAILAAAPLIIISNGSGKFNTSSFLLLGLISAMIIMITASFGILDPFMERFLSIFSGDDDTGSGRFIFWGLILDKMANFDIFQIMFGEGVGVLSNFLSLRFGIAIGAHNDFLDLFFTYGIISSFFLLFFYCTSIFVLFKYRRAIKDKTEYLCSFGIIFYLFFTSAVSGGALDVQASALYFALGLCLGNIKNARGCN
jgi:hypothetical protein